MATILVASTVHHPDDPRIREKLIRTLGLEHEIVYATSPPGPSDASGLRWLPLRGRRLRRNLGLWRIALFSRFDVLSLHDPEALPIGIVVRLIRRKRVVFDVHERIPEQARRHLPGMLGTIGAWVALRLLRLAERVHEITLAEAGYREMLRREHPVFPNHLLPDRLPDVEPEGDGSVVYLGDVTEQRGITDLVEACARARVRLVLIGRVSSALRQALASRAQDYGLEVELTGHLDHPAALARVASASVGVSPLRDHPNYRHSLPTKVLEYAALGLPIVASDLPGTRQALAGIDAVWFHPPGDADALADALAAATDPDVRPAVDHAMKVRSRFRWPSEKVLDHFSGTERN